MTRNTNGDLTGRNDIRLTIDTLEDLNNARKIHEDLSLQNSEYGLKDIVDYLDNHEEMRMSMSKIIECNTKK